MNVNSNRYIQVLLTYIRRPMFWGLGLWLVLFELVMVFAHINDPYHVTAGYGPWVDNASWIFCIGSTFLLPAAVGTALVFHLREQLGNWRNILIPDYRNPNLIIGRWLFIGAFILLTIVYFFTFNNSNYWFDPILFSLILLFILLLTGACWWTLRWKWLWVCLVLLAVGTPLLMSPGFYDDYSHYFYHDRIGISAITFAFILMFVCILALTIALWAKYRSLWSWFFAIPVLLVLGTPWFYLHSSGIYYSLFSADIPYVDRIGFLCAIVLICTLSLTGVFWVILRSSGSALLLISSTICIALFFSRLIAFYPYLQLQFIFSSEDRNFFVGLLMFISSTMLISGWWASFKSPWFSFFLGPLGILIFILFTQGLITYFSPTTFEEPIIKDLIWGYTLKVLPPTLLAAFIALFWKLSRSGRRCGKISMRMINVSEESRAKPARAMQASKALVHQPVTSFFARANQRRVSLFGPWAIWSLAIFLAIVLTMMGKIFFVFTDDTVDTKELVLQASLILLSIIPTIAVVCVWVERLPFLASESLYPASRPKFVYEMAAALASDFVLFWLAGLAAALIPLSLFIPETMHAISFWNLIATTAISQVSAFGAIALAISFRSSVFMVIASMVVMGWMVIPIESVLSNGLMTFFIHDMVVITLSIHDTLIWSLPAAGLGAILALIAYFRWQRIELAAR